VRRLLAIPLVLGVAGVAGCGSSSTAENAASMAPASVKFPDPAGRTLQQLADRVKTRIGVGLAAQTFVPGRERISFALLDDQHRYLSAPAAVYVASGPDRPARGPYPAPSDPLTVPPAFRSRIAAAGDIDHVYAAHVPLKRPGRQLILMLTRMNGKLAGGPASIDVVKGSKIPNVGDRPPAVATDTVTSAGGNIAAIDTRVPHDDMHRESFADVVGKKPVALLFATPALCQSRVCGPVTDVLLELEQKYKDRMTFIHQEVYRNNQIKDGLRPSLQAFHLESEPWLFVVNRHGRVAARLEGAFGVDGAEAAIRAGLR
jgi:hypothetical protein